MPGIVIAGDGEFTAQLSYSGMIFSENRFTLFRIMPQPGGRKSDA
jgi:hypothetical protein